MSFICAASLFVTVTGWLLASPAQDLDQALKANGAQNAKAASADSFIEAFTSVLVTVEDKDSAAYVAAAKKLRPDLSNQISAAAADVETAPEDANSGTDRRVSRHRHKVAVCCHYHRSFHTVYIPAQYAQRFLATHPQCRQGRCSPRHNPDA